jgi:predicted nuclease of restriction endonuclease-like (RecB) superfamily
MKLQKVTLNYQDVQLNELFGRISSHIESARQNVLRTVNTQMVCAYWQIGKEIVEEEQHGHIKAAYGTLLLKKLSIQLENRYGRGFSVRTLEDARKFYLEYSEAKISKQLDSISHAVREKCIPSFHSNLGWTHYRLLMRIKRKEAREFYENEAISNHWSARELERQIATLLFDRLARSKDKEGIMKLANKGHTVVFPQDAIKEPVVLEFLGIPETYRLVESQLEEAIINNLQDFLLELGKGFAFVGRQKRLTLDGDHFYADLVFYHVILKCYIIIDIKTKKLSHADLGQMQLYVNYFDQEVITSSDNPTIGLILCTKKSDEMVKYMLGDRAKQIFASTYQLHLPTAEELQAEIQREVEAFGKTENTPNEKTGE